MQLHGTDINLNMVDLPTFIGMRQRDFHMELRVTVSVSGGGSTKYLSSEVAEGFTSVMTALYSVGGTAEFTGFSCTYSD